MVYYRMRSFKTMGDTGFADPRIVDNNSFTSVFEGYVENGYPSEEPRYGRMFRVDINCRVGFFSKTDKNMPNLHGKGILIPKDHHYKEGIWSKDDPNNVFRPLDNPIESFFENELPD